MSGARRGRKRSQCEYWVLPQNIKNSVHSDLQLNRKNVVATFWAYFAYLLFWNLQSDGPWLTTEMSEQTKKTSFGPKVLCGNRTVLQTSQAKCQTVLQTIQTKCIPFSKKNLPESFALQGRLILVQSIQKCTIKFSIDSKGVRRVLLLLLLLMLLPV